MVYLHAFMPGVTERKTNRVTNVKTILPAFELFDGCKGFRNTLVQVLNKGKGNESDDTPVFLSS